MATTGYLSFPHVHGDLIVFVAEDDVWLAPVTGGRGWRLSADHPLASRPRFSRDGTQVAWTGRRDDTAEVYLAATDGGISRRLTFWGDDSTRVCGWTPSGEVLAVSAVGQPFGHFSWAHAINPGAGAGAPAGDAGAGSEAGAGSAGGVGETRLPFGPVADLAVEDAGVALLTARHGREPAFWKRYRGGTAGRLWVRADAGAGVAGGGEGGGGEGGGEGAGPAFRRLLAEVPGQFQSPMLVGGRLVVLSDHEGTANLYSCALDGGDLRRHTDHDGGYARNASTDGTRIVYTVAGRVWLLDGLEADEPRPLEITLGSVPPGRTPRLISADDHIGALSCDATGRASAVEVRGTVHWLTHRDGPAIALSVTPGGRARLPEVLGRDGSVVWVTDAEGQDALETGSAKTDSAPGQPAPHRLASGAIGQVDSLAAAPDGSKVAVASLDGRLRLVDMASGAVTELAASDNGEVSGLAWSTDSAWLAWSHPGTSPLRRLRIARVADGQISDVTDGRFADTDPVFTIDGKYLAFLSKRSFDPVYDAHVFDLSFPFGARPFLVPLAASTISPFGPQPGGRGIGGDPDDDDDDESPDAAPDSATPAGAGSAGSEAPASQDAPAADGPAAEGPAPDSTAAETPAAETPAADASGKSGAAKDKDAAKPVVVDVAGIADRVVALPVRESRYSALRAVKGGLVWLREPLTGSLGDGGARPDDIGPRPVLQRFDLRRHSVTALEDDVDWFEVSGDGARLVVSQHGSLTVIPSEHKADSDSPDDQISVDGSRARFLADPAALWRHAFDEAGRLIRHDFWVADMADVEWDTVQAQYRPLVDLVATPREFADVLWETVGELGTSHAYVGPAPYDDGVGTYSTGLLGADLEQDSDGSWRVRRIVPGETSDPKARSPLSAPGVQIRPGDRLLAVDGRPVGADGPGPLLAGVAGQPVELLVAGADGGPRRAVVVPLTTERRLRYQDWVAGRRARVRDLSGGRLGYLHSPDMISEGWADFHRDLREEMTRDALVIDVRGNRGGHTSQLIIEKLARRVVAWDVPRNMQPVPYPVEAPRGPVVVLADEFAGSDGDVITQAIRTLGLGPVVGARTWGGVVGIDGWHELVDGTSITVPRYALWFEGRGWGVENYGVDPDVEVLITPEDWAAGRDTQLEEAVRIALASLEAHPAATPPTRDDRPSRRRPPLPPRSAS